METLTNKVHKFRKEAKITQEQLARAIGVTRQTVIAVEKRSLSGYEIKR